MISMPGKDSTHGQNPAASLPIAQKVEGETQGTEHSFILDDPPRLQQVHRSLGFSLNREAFGFEKTLPLRNRQRPGAVVDDAASSF